MGVNRRVINTYFVFRLDCTDVDSAVDGAEVAERLWVVFEQFAGLRDNLLREEAQRTHKLENVFEQRPCFLDVAGEGETVDEPERTEDERSSPPGRPSSPS